MLPLRRHFAFNVIFRRNTFRPSHGSVMSVSHDTSHPMHSLARSFMYVPCDQMKKIEKVAAMRGANSPDIVVLDLEDGVGYQEKDQARKNLSKILNADHAAFRSDSWIGAVAVRVNPIGSELATQDWAALPDMLQGKKVHLVNVPKVETVDHVKWIAEQMRLLNHTGIGLSLMIESALGIVNVAEICQWMHANGTSLSFQPHSLVFGSDDYCASLGVKRTEASAEVLYARQKLVNVAKAFKLHAIDMVHIDFKDLESLRGKCEFGASLGYSGKQVIHPAQLATVHKAFAPSEKQVQWARGLLTAFEATNRTGVFVFENQMIDRPTVLQAKAIQAMDNAIAGKLKEK